MSKSPTGTKRVSSKDERIPPWERAQMIIRMHEEERKRKMLETSTKARSRTEHKRLRNPSPLDSLDVNRRRLREIRERMRKDQ